MKSEPIRPAQIELRSAALSIIQAPWLAFAILAASAPLLLIMPINHDSIWQMWLGQKMLGGAALYRDLIEVNPPLWFWIAEPLAALGLDPAHTVAGFFVFSIAVSLALTPTRLRLPSLAVMVLVPLHDFGQREHFTLISTIPYVLAIAQRRKGEPPRLPLLVGLFAGVGLCLKPYFVLVPVALEVLVWSRRRLRPEVVGLALFMAGYAVSTLLFAPDFLTVQVPMDLRFYGAFGMKPFFVAFVIGVTYLLAAVGFYWGRRRASPESVALVVASLAFIPAVVLQYKGFPYQAIPVRGLLALAALLEIINARRNPLADSLLLASAIACCMPVGLYSNAYQREFDRHLAGVKAGTSIIVVSSNPSIGWPDIAERKLDWQLHAFSVWQINAVVQDPSLAPEVRRIYASDFAKRPSLLVIDRRPILGEAAMSILPPGYLKCYKSRERTPRLESFVRVC